MAKKKNNVTPTGCTKHHIFLCENVKKIVKRTQAETSHQISIGDAINKIILEFDDLKK